LNRLLKSLILILAFLAGTPSTAAVIYRSVPDLTADPLCPCFSSGGNTRLGTAFTLSSATTLTGISFVVGNYAYWPAPVTIGIYRADGYRIGNQLFGGTYSNFNSVTDTGHLTSVVNISLGNPTLSAGSYYVFFGNPVGLTMAGFTTGNGDGRVIRNANTHASYVGDRPELFLKDIGVQLFASDRPPLGGATTFLTAGVPEPASWALMIGGFGLAGATARRRRRTMAI
jgi:hypothetical protein